MTDEAAQPAHYGIEIDRGSVTSEEVALGREGEEGLRFTVRLAGQADERWRKCFRFVQQNSTGFFRFRLEDRQDAISFTVRRTDGQDDVDTVLGRLSSFVSLVNRSASSPYFEEDEEDAG
jgi:hypothetical protein